MCLLYHEVLQCHHIWLWKKQQLYAYNIYTNYLSHFDRRKNKWNADFCCEHKSFKEIPSHWIAIEEMLLNSQIKYHRKYISTSNRKTRVIYWLVQHCLPYLAAAQAAELVSKLKALKGFLGLPLALAPAAGDGGSSAKLAGSDLYILKRFKKWILTSQEGGHDTDVTVTWKGTKEEVGYRDALAFKEQARHFYQNL